MSDPGEGERKEGNVHILGGPGLVLGSLCPAESSLTELPQGFPSGASGKEPTCQCRRHKRLRFHPWVGKIPWRRACNLFQCSCLEDPVDRGAWCSP